MNKPMREAIGDALLEMGENEEIVVLDADLSKATTTWKFASKYPERFFNMGIAEQNLLGTAAGLAISGLKPFASTFSIFAVGRAFEQIRNAICYPNLNVKIVATHAGLSPNADGGSHQSIEDIALMRVLPNMMVLSPSDYLEAKTLLLQLNNHKGPVYMRLSRHPAKSVYSKGDKLDLYKARLLTSGDELLVVTTGVMTGIALEAAERAAKTGVSVGILSVHTIKPLDTETLLIEARKTKKVLTLEEHSVIGGLGSAVAEALSMETDLQVSIHGIKDKFGQSGDYEELMSAYGLDVDSVYERILKMAGGKGNA